MRNKLQLNFNQNSNIFIQENALENGVWKWRPFCLGLNVLSLTDAYMPQWTGTSLVHVMACGMFGAKPLHVPAVAYCQFDPYE